MPLNPILQTDITANNRQFVNSINQSKAAANNFALSTKKAFAGLGRSLAAGFAGVSFVGLLTNAGREIDNIGKQVSKFQTTAKGFQFLEYAARRSDVEISSVELGLTKLRSTLASAVGGNTTAIDTFKQLGLSVKELSGLKVDEVYLKVGEAIRKLKDSSSQINLANKIFGGRQGQEQLQLLLQDLSSMQSVFNGFNTALSESDLATYDKLDEKLDNITTKLKGNLREAVVALTPAIIAFGDTFSLVLSTIVSGINSASSALSDFLDSSKPDPVSGKYDPSFFQQYISDPLSQSANDALDIISGKNTQFNSVYTRSKTKLDPNSPAAQKIQESALNGIRKGNNEQLLIRIEADQNGLMKAFASSPTAKIIINNAVVSAAAAEAASTGF